MTLSELRAAAERLATIETASVKHMHMDDRVNGIEQMLKDLLMLAKNDGCIAAAWAHEFACTIAGTVREDDREAISDEWWRTLSHAWFADLFGEEKLCLLVHDNVDEDPDNRLLAVFHDDGSWGLWEQDRVSNELHNPHQSRFRKVKTRGQVRDLCRVLGVPLSEARPRHAGRRDC